MASKRRLKRSVSQQNTPSDRSTPSSPLKIQPPLKIEKLGKPSESSGSSHKKRKRELLDPAHNAATLIANHNLLISELFSLKEYKSVLYWDPASLSSVSGAQIPEIFEDYVKKNPDLLLSWSKDPQGDRKRLLAIPLRLQKREFVKMEQDFKKLYPFKEEADNQAIIVEKQILKDIDITRETELDRPSVDEPDLVPDQLDAEIKLPDNEPEQEEVSEVQVKSTPRKPKNTKTSTTPTKNNAKNKQTKSTKSSKPTKPKTPVKNSTKPPAKNSVKKQVKGLTKSKSAPLSTIKNTKTKMKKEPEPAPEHLSSEEASENEEEMDQDNEEMEDIEDPEEKPLGSDQDIEENGQEIEEIDRFSSSEEIDYEYDTNDEDLLKTHYKVKQLQFTVPAPIITHPSHIASWRPTNEEMSNNMSSQGTVYESNLKPIKVTSSLGGEIRYEPDPINAIENFFEEKFKSAIVDESIMPDYNSTPQEFEAITNQQINLVKRLYQKVNVERRLELNGEKIEQRKDVLPQATATNLKSLLDPFRANDVSLTSKSGSTSSNLTHDDLLIAHGTSFLRIHQLARKAHVFKARRVAQIVELYFRKKAGEKERLEREKEQNLRRISRLAIQAVKKRWTQANKVYKVLQQQEEEELKRIKGREHLSQMLEHSTNLLEQQLASGKVNKEQNETFHEEDNSTDNSSLSDDHFSSESNSSDEDDGDKTTDENLTVEELKSKYKNLDESTSLSLNSSETEDSEDDLDVSKGLSALYGDSEAPKSTIPDASSVTEYTETQKKLIESISNDKEMSVLDSASEESSDLESDSSGSESGSNSEVDSESLTNHSTAKTKSNGLASLFGKEVKDDSDDAEINSGSDSDENMSASTDEEDEPKTPKSEKDGGEQIINGATVRDVPLPSLLRGTLRPYQKQGLNWMASLYNNNTNGILADEMGLGKTIQTISLLSYLACEHHIWGPHLIVVPTSVMLNWEMEFKKFAPGFKVLTYYGSPQQRAAKRKGWNKPDAFHVCITSYQLVVHDNQSFKRRKWRYMILDEAHNIKNFRSARWKALLNFNTENRLLLTGTPLQNNLIELWSLLYFLMPSSKVNQAMPDGFANLEDFQQWFGKPVDRILEQATLAQGNPDIIDEEEKTTAKMDAETKHSVARLHQVLRPYILRRLKKDVEKQMPGKYEHIIYCRLSNRQRYLYDDFMSKAKTKETLQSGNFLSIINCLMQLRKVCNHPDLFEVRPIVTSFALPNGVATLYAKEALVVSNLLTDVSFDKKVSLDLFNFDFIRAEDKSNIFVSQSLDKLRSIKGFDDQITELGKIVDDYPGPVHSKKGEFHDYLDYYKSIKVEKQMSTLEKLKQIKYLNNLRCTKHPLYGESFLNSVRSIGTNKPVTDIYRLMTLSIEDRSLAMRENIEQFSVLTPTVVALDMKDQLIPVSTQALVRSEVAQGKVTNPFHQAQVKLSIAFPDKNLLQYDCGKLQKLAGLLQDLTAGGHRALIFTQMTKVLDILEQFLNIHGYRYMRLDGSTKIEDRQLMTEKFNRDSKIPVFILSTRSGGLGINLTGADTVIFYDSDWNPAMDKQCQDRCHRIGQSRDVHIYRFVSEYTIESNILRKANQKRTLDNVIIQEGEFTTEYFGKFSVKDIVGNADIKLDDKPLLANVGNVNSMLAQAEDEDDRVAANEAMKEEQIDDEDFNDEAKGGYTADGTPSTTPGPNGTNVANGRQSGTPMETGKVEGTDLDFDEGVGHIDEYMLRFISDGNYWD